MGFEKDLEAQIGNGITHKMIGQIDPNFSSSNIGDEIIVSCCAKILDAKFPHHFVIGHSVHCRANTYAKFKLNQCEYVFVLGSNLLCSDIENFNQWQFYGLEEINSKPILMGCGWQSYSTKTTDKSSKWIKKVLNKNFFHSVRDEYTKEKLEEIGIENVINTSCPTVWSLKRQIVGKKSKTAVIVFNYAFRNHKRDRMIWDYANREYDDCHIWPQGYLDCKYFEEMNLPSDKILTPRLDSLKYELTVKKADYIGTRLHSGILAIRLGCSVSIVAVDNRARELLGDLGGVYFDGENEHVAESISNTRQSNVMLNVPKGDIEKWLNQF